MKYTSLFQKIAYVTFGLAFAVSAVALAAFNEPSAPAPAANLPAPVHAGGSQAKSGGLSVRAISVVEDARFDQQTFISGIIKGPTVTRPGRPSTSTVAAFGTNSIGINISASDSISAYEAIKSGAVSGSTSTNPVTLCANQTGTIYKCN